MQFYDDFNAQVVMFPPKQLYENSMFHFLPLYLLQAKDYVKKILIFSKSVSNKLPAKLRKYTMGHLAPVVA